MKRYLHVMLILVLLTFSTMVQARSHKFLGLEITAQLGADGLVRMTERHTVEFNGKFSGMNQWIDTSRGVQLTDVLISENGVPYTRLEQQKPGPAGTYFIEQKQNRVNIDWSFEAENEIRTFELSYVLGNVVLKHQDVAEFYYQFVGDQWEEPRDYVRVTLTLPVGAVRDEIGAWGFGPSHGSVEILSATEVAWEVKSLPARTFLEGQVIFPLSLVPAATRVTNKERLPELLAEEEAQLAREQTLAKRKAIDPYIAMFAAALGYLLTFYIWTNFAKPYPGYKEKYYKELPANYPPAELAILYYQTVRTNDLTATLLSLASRGFIVIEELPSLQGKRTKQVATYKFSRQAVSPDQLQQLRLFEVQLLEFLFQEVSGGELELTLEDFQAFAKKNRKGMLKFWQEWGKTVKEDAAKRHGFFDEVSTKKSPWFFIPAVGLIGIAIVCFALNLVLTGIALMVFGIAAILTITVALGRRSAQGNRQYGKWKAFRRYLRDVSRLESTRIGSASIWDQFLPYAVTLGVANQVLKHWSFARDNLEQSGVFAHWFIYGRSGGVSSLQHMTDSINKSISSTIVQSGGTGGGFSGGGGGGFGGGGGGVR